MKFFTLFFAGAMLLAGAQTAGAETEPTGNQTNENTGNTANEPGGNQAAAESAISSADTEELQDGILAPSPGKGVSNTDATKTHIKSPVMPRDLPLLHIGGNGRNFYVGLGGSVKATAGYDWGHVLNNANEFIVSAIPMSQRKGDGGLYQVSAQQTELFLSAGYNPGDKYEVAAYVNGRFLGKNYGFQLENAYVSFMGFTVGYGYGLFCDTWAAPNTIDYEGPNAMIAVTGGMLNYRHNFGRWTVGAGIDLPQASFTAAEGRNYQVNQRIPDFPLMVQYNLPGGGHIGGAVIIRGLQYHNSLKGKNETVCGWGVRVSGVGTLYGPVGFCFQGAFGRGMASYIQDLSGLGLDLVPEGDSPEGSGSMKAVKAYGLMGGLTFNFSRTVSANACYSHVRAYIDPYVGGTTAWGDQYSYGQYAVGNVMWKIKSFLTWGVEYIYGRRVNMDSSQAHDNRLQTMLQVNF